MTQKRLNHVTLMHTHKDRLDKLGILTLRALMSHICDISPLRVRRLFLATRSCPNACNWRKAQADERG